MTQLRKILWLTVLAAAGLLLPSRVMAQSGTVTDDGFISTNSTTQALNLNGQGIVLVVAGSSATVGNSNVGATKAYVKFQLTSSLPPGTAAANVAKATLKLYLSSLTKPSGAIDIYPITSAWTESTLNPSSPPTLASTAFAMQVPVGQANSFLVVDVTKLVQEWLAGSANGGIDNDGIALVADTSTTYVVFDSKESIVTSHEPRLEIVLANSGPQGPVGPQGPKGATGPAGGPGPAGAPGAAATIKVEPTMTVPYGTPASVMNAGTPGAADLTFLIPQGPPGINNRGQWTGSNSYNVNDAVTDNGSYWLALAATNASTSCEPAFPPSPCAVDWQILAAAGAQGLPGQTGAPGAQGIPGQTGQTGATGAQGLTGQTGPQGAQGIPGLPGTNGQTGATGAQGPAGPVGINNRGLWSSANSYSINDAVSDGGSYWLAIAATSASSAMPNTSCEPAYPPSPCAADWQLLAAQGAQGPQGQSGAQGAGGVPGAPGAVGPAGPQGPQGPAGAAGGAANLSQAPLFASAFFPGALTGNGYTAGKLVPDDPITITRVTAEVASPGDPSCSSAILRLGNGSKGEDVYITGNQTEADSGSGVLTFPGGAPLRASLRSSPACLSGAAPGSANLLIEYRTQVTGESDACPGGQIVCNGFCESTALDPGNCGACGTACFQGQYCANGACGGSIACTVSSDCPNVGNSTNPTCLSGTCVFACNPGFGDCNHNPTDGCETNLTYNSQNCGACGNVCGAGLTCWNSACVPAGQVTCTPSTTCPTEPNTSAPSCQNGTCIWACTPGFGDCDRNPLNGCETNLTNDINNCGSCGAVCSLPNATAACSNSYCSLVSCNAGYGNCDGIAANGCKFNLNSDVNNCGACGKACSNGAACFGGSCVAPPPPPPGWPNGSFPNATGICTGTLILSPAGNAWVDTRSCSITSCNPGYGNCDGITANGCETNINSDVNNCGACGKACASGTTCSNGACTANCGAGQQTCGSSCSPLHSNGLGQSYALCVPLGTPGNASTYTAAMAQGAAAAFSTPGTTSLSCNGAGAVGASSAQGFAVWVYQGTFAGYVSISSSQYLCPTSGSLTWN